MAGALMSVGLLEIHQVPQTLTEDYFKKNKALEWLTFCPDISASVL